MARFLPTILISFALLPAAHGQASAAQSPATASPEMKQMQHIEDSWSDAVNKKDQYGIELVLSPIFIDISSSGEVTTRNQQIAALVTNTDNIQDLDQKVVTVRVLGDMAIVNGTYSFKKKKDGTPVEEKGIFSHVYQRVRSNWLCVSSQRTPLVQNDIVKAKKAKPETKKSNAELPLHIPFIHKGADKSTDSSTLPPSPSDPK